MDTRAHILLALGRKEEALVDFSSIARTGPPDSLRRYQQILRLRGYDQVQVTGEYSDDFLASLKDCIETGCKLAFDVELN